MRNEDDSNFNELAMYEPYKSAGLNILEEELLIAINNALDYYLDETVESQLEWTSKYGQQKYYDEYKAETEQEMREKMRQCYYSGKIKAR